MCRWLMKGETKVFERMAGSCGKFLRMLERLSIMFCFLRWKLLMQMVGKA